jgi:hypothetical protein
VDGQYSLAAQAHYTQLRIAPGIEATQALPERLRDMTAQIKLAIQVTDRESWVEVDTPASALPESPCPAAGPYGLPTACRYDLWPILIEYRSQETSQCVEIPCGIFLAGQEMDITAPALRASAVGACHGLTGRSSFCKFGPHSEREIVAIGYAVIEIPMA